MIYKMLNYLTAINSENFFHFLIDISFNQEFLDVFYLCNVTQAEVALYAFSMAFKLPYISELNLLK